jgi:hypothetical protein
MNKEQIEGNILWIYSPEHRTIAEGSRLKTHVSLNEKTFCGYSSGTGGGTGGEATMEFLTQSDPDNILCKKCKKAAILWYNQQPK